MHRPSSLADGHTQLLLRAQGGDPGAFAELFTALSPVVRHFALSMDKRVDINELDDLVQEVFLRVWQNLARYRGEASAKTFVLSIAKNLLLRGMSRRRRYQGAQLDGQDYPCKVQDHAPDELIQAVVQALSKLTEAQRQAAVLVLIKEVSRPEALALAQCGANQFGKRLQRARKSLRCLLNTFARCILT